MARLLRPSEWLYIGSFHGDHEHRWIRCPLRRSIHCRLLRKKARHNDRYRCPRRRSNHPSRSWCQQRDVHRRQVPCRVWLEHFHRVSASLDHRACIPAAPGPSHNNVQHTMVPRVDHSSLDRIRNNQVQRKLILADPCGIAGSDARCAARHSMDVARKPTLALLQRQTRRCISDSRQGACTL